MQNFYFQNYNSGRTRNLVGKVREKGKRKISSGGKTAEMFSG